MAIMPYLIMSELIAAQLREMTQHDVNARVDPVLIRGGPEAGKYALPERVKRDPDLETHWDAFIPLRVAALDELLAWPTLPEDMLTAGDGDS